MGLASEIGVAAIVYYQMALLPHFLGHVGRGRREPGVSVTTTIASFGCGPATQKQKAGLSTVPPFLVGFGGG